MTGLWAGHLQELWFASQQEQEIYLFSKMFRPARGSTQPPDRWVSRVMWLKCETDGSPHVVPRLGMNGPILPHPTRSHGVHRDDIYLDN